VLTDPIADMLTRIRNANKALHEHATMPSSRMKVDIAKLLKEEGYIRDYHVEKGESFDTLVIDLKFGRNRERVISGLKRVSKPGRRVYARKDRLPRVLGGMSRIGNAPIPVPDGVTVTIEPARVAVAGPLGTLQQQVPTRMKIEQRDGEVVVSRPTERGEDRALHGLTRTLVANMVQGVTQGFEKKLEIQGVGYRAQLKGTDLELSVGYSHTVTIKPRTGITFEVPTPTEIFVKGTDKQMVGQTAAEIRKVRPPEPYKGKGIRYEGEYVRRKVGKRA
jgi:large subunit ribosomal protein L6